MKERKQKRILSRTIFIICLIFLGFAYLFLIFIPGYSSQIFGPPSPLMDNAHRILLSTRLFLKRDFLLIPNSNMEKERLFIINPGESVQEISEDLKREDFIKDPRIFQDYLVYKGIDRFMRSGTYQLDPKMKPLEIAAAFYDPNPQDVAFSFLAGWRAEEIASLLPTSGLSISTEEFLNEVSKPRKNFSSLLSAKPLSIEGFLFPGNYKVLRSITSDQLIFQLTNSFIGHLPKDYEVSLKKTGLSLYQTVILASIIEKEKILSEEAPIIASVFINRLNSGLPLQSDATVQYGLGYDDNQKTWWKNPLSSKDLNVESPYNTYLHKGLPPMPICNPGMESIVAALKPSKTDFLYFRAACDSSASHIFSSTYEDHLKAECK
jgi:UPF0755 protein